MQNTKIRQWVLTGCAGTAILYLFFTQSQTVWKSVPVEVGTRIAYGYSDVTFSGTVYHDQGITHVGAGTGVSIHINGSTGSTTTTNGLGVYTFSSLTISANNVVTVFIDNENEDGVLVAKFNDSELSDQSVTGMDIYKDRLILRTSTSDLNITSVNLQLADDETDGDINAIYSYNGRDLRLGRDKELFVWPSTTHTASGYVFTHDLEVRGTLRMGTGTITASGSVVIPGTISTSGSTILTSYASGDVLQVTGSTLYNLYVDFGAEAYFRMDEGTGPNASGATLVSSTGGTLTNGAYWVSATSGTTLFYNPYAVELDGSNDFVTFGDTYDISSAFQRTYSAWFRRKSSDTEDVIFAKKTASGASAAGYMLSVDDASDKLYFEVANGTDNYLVVSNSAITDQNWHHVAVSYNPHNTRATNIFLDGAIDVASKSGALESNFVLAGAFGNTSPFRLGATASDTLAFHGTVDDLRMYTRAMSGAEISVLAAGEKSTGSGTYYLRDSIVVRNDFCVYAGTLDVSTGSSLTVRGDFCAYGGLLRTNSGTVTLNGDSQTIRGSTAFNQLAKTSTTSVTLTFETNTLQSFSGAITLQGAVNERMSIRATRTGSQAYVASESSGSELLKHLDVKDNNASGGALMYCSLGCIDSGNTDNWFFDGDCGDGVVNTGEECDDGDSDNNDVCPNDCQFPVCGDGTKEGLEECEPPNSGACQSNCLLRGAGGGGGGRGSSSSAASFAQQSPPPEGCGNGVLDTDKGEECDAGTRFNGLGTCSRDCKKRYCGDGVVSFEIGEDCEPKLIGETNGKKVFEVAKCGDTCTAPKVTAQGTVVGGCRKRLQRACTASSSSSDGLHGAAGECGNGIVDAGEECDFGGTCVGGQFGGSFWTDKDSAAACASGGGTTEPASGDGCSVTCNAEFCGDGFVQERGADNQPQNADDEQCDNGSVCSGNSAKSCRLNTDCSAGETCDYHAAKNRSCSATCKSVAAPKQPEPKPSAPECGNGRSEESEECDEGKSNGSDGATCSAECKTKEAAKEPACGDGIVQNEEVCDNGARNSDVNANTCRTNCEESRCGDFVVDSGEECDNGDGNSDLYSDSCRLNCRLPSCGDGIVDSNEECDGGLSCRRDCTFALRLPRCANGILESQEECDDGNTTDGDGCNAFCRSESLRPSAAVCGNGILEEGEQCDDGNVENGDACSSECRSTGVRGTVASLFVLDADIVIVNPEEIADALKFLETDDPCSTLVIKGKNQKAQMIREAALRQGIPIVKNVELAREIFGSINPGQVVFGALCDGVNKLRGREKPAAAAMQPFPQYPTPFAYGFYNYAQVAPIIQAQPPAGDTGPAAVTVAIAGAAGGIGWMRRKFRR